MKEGKCVHWKEGVGCKSPDACSFKVKGKPREDGHGVPITRQMCKVAGHLTSDKLQAKERKTMAFRNRTGWGQEW